MLGGLALLLFAAVPAAAQIVPMPEEDNMRVHRLEWERGQQFLLTVLPGASLTVMLEEGEVIDQVSVSRNARLEVRVPSDGNSFIIVPQDDIRRASITVETSERRYPFIVRTQESGLAALMVRFQPPSERELEASEPVLANSQTWSYSFRGDREVLPVSVRDDTQRTFIEYGPEQALPAVFAIGPVGEEEAVNGYMRDGLYVIDRVYQELVFRIDDERARARRNSEPDGEG